MAAKRPDNQAPIPAEAPVVLLTGEDRFQLLDRTEGLRAALEKKHGELMIVHFDGGSAGAAEILDECRAMGLMMQHKLVVVDRLDELFKGDDEPEDGAPAPARRPGEKSPRELMESYAERPDSSATLVLRAESVRAPRLEKVIAASGGVVLKCDPPKPDEAVRWAIERATSHHKRAISRDGAELLVSQVGAMLGRLDCELAKLALAAEAAGSGTITPELVRRLCGETSEDDPWGLQSVLLSGNVERSLLELTRLLEVARQSPVFVGFTYLDLARKLDGVARGLAAREPMGAITQRVRLWGQAGAMVEAKAKKLPTRTTAALLRLAVDADRRQKSGGGDPVRILTSMTVRFARALA